MDDWPRRLEVDWSPPDVLKVVGELEAGTVANFYDAVASHDAASMEIDLSGLEFVDSAGLRALIIVKRDHHVRFVRPTRRVVSLLDQTDLIDLLGLRDADVAPDPVRPTPE